MPRPHRKKFKYGKRILKSHAELQVEPRTPTEKAQAALVTLEPKLKTLGGPGEKLLEEAKKYERPHDKLRFLLKGVAALKQTIADQSRHKEKPVDIRTFMTSKDYMNMPIKPRIDEAGEVYPKVMEELEAMCAGEFIEIVCTGSIGSAKTSIALMLLAYSLYTIACLRDPHTEFGLMKSDEIVIIFQSLNSTHAKTVDYGRFKAMIANAPWFQKNFMYDKTIDSALNFPNRICVKPVSGSSTAAIGQNVIGGLIDEINFMKITQKSKLSRDAGEFNQAYENYNALVRRRESRFMKMGKVPGILCLVSSKRYPGEFTDQKMDEAKKQPEGKKTIYIYDKRSWDIAPPGKYSGETFRLFIGDLSRRARVLDDNDIVPPEDLHLVDLIPIEHLNSFKTDLLGSLRDVAGKSTLAVEPFIIEIDKVRACFGELDSILSQPTCDFENTRIEFYPGMLRDLNEPRWIHIDLATTGDSAGVTCGYVAGFRDIARDEDNKETMPIIRLDFILEVEPPPNAEIQFHKIRSLIYKLKAAGLNIKWVSFDSFQSVDSIQILQRKGFSCGVQSMDKETMPYDITKIAFMDGRVEAPEHDKCYTEIISLEKDSKKGKIDHPQHCGKDLADSVAGVVFGLTMRREIWLKFGIKVIDIPPHLISAANTNKNSVDKHSGNNQVTDEETE